MNDVDLKITEWWEKRAVEYEEAARQRRAEGREGLAVEYEKAARRYREDAKFARERAGKLVKDLVH